MHLNDPIADLLTRIRNAQHARRTECVAPWSKIKLHMCELLVREGYVESVEVEGEGVKQQLVVHFLPHREPLALKRISSPGSRKYVSGNAIRPHLHGASLAILSTSHGLLTDKQAREKKIGGELLCTIS